ncbi:hypothetical protein, partial [Staphylococcus argenteus]|uniref:hypothetical protein n=1 Tax=Staphylococcus argenteus TaxID=985002 RepID=UPI00403F0218
MRDVGLIDVEDCYEIYWMWCLFNGGLKMLFYGDLKLSFRKKKTQQNLDLTVTSTFN